MSESGRYVKSHRGPAAGVIDVLSRLFSIYGQPAFIRSDNGPEFVANALQHWLREQGVGTSYIEPGKPWQNGVAESYNNRFRDECLGVEWFNNRLEAKVVIECWRQGFNDERPHSSNNYVTPSRRWENWINDFGAKWGFNYEQQPRELSVRVVRRKRAGQYKQTRKLISLRSTECRYLPAVSLDCK